MKNTKTLIILCLCLCVFSCQRKSGRKSIAHTTQIESAQYIDYDYSVKVIAISDGDTFKGITQDKIEIRFRLQGIDAPEKGQPFSNKSKEKLSELIYGKRVGIKVHTKHDKYGRPVVYVYTPEGLDAGSEMLKAGMAWHFKKYDNSDIYSRLEQIARNQKVGLWQYDNPISPWDYKQMKK